MLQILPITQLSLENIEKFGTLNHGFDDIPFFPSWAEFYRRSMVQNSQYPNYMAYVLVNGEKSPPIGILAVQLMHYNKLKQKVRVVIEEIDHYLYLSWIALDSANRNVNYFAILFDFYQSLIRKLRLGLQKRIEGAAISIRRMRPILWRVLNCNIDCPTTTNVSIVQDTSRFTFTFQPSELFDKNLIPAQDHILIIFKKRR